MGDGVGFDPGVARHLPAPSQQRPEDKQCSETCGPAERAAQLLGSRGEAERR